MQSCQMCRQATGCENTWQLASGTVTDASIQISSYCNMDIMHLTNRAVAKQVVASKCNVRAQT